MAKKLITILLTFTIIACSSISVFAGTEEQSAEQEIINTENTFITDDIKAEPTAEITEENTVADAAVKEDTPAKDEPAKETAKAENPSKYQKGLAAYIRYINPNISKQKSISMAGHFIKKGKKNNIDPKVLMAIAQNESTFYEKAKSPYGYKGLMQTSDALARNYGYKPSSLLKAEVSIDVGARYLGAMKKMFGTYTKAISAYAYGSGTVKNGNYSKAIANKILKTRTNISKYLKRNHYI